MRYRWLAGFAWVAAVTAAWLLGWEWRFVAIVVTAPLAGAILRRWAAVLLPAVVPLAAALSGEQIYDLGPAWQVALLLLLPPTMAALALGIAIGTVVDRSRTRRRAGFR